MFKKTLFLFLLFFGGCKQAEIKPITEKLFALSSLQDDTVDANFIDNLDNKPLSEKPSVLKENMNKALQPKKVEWSITPHAELLKKIKENPEGAAKILEDIDIKKPELQGNIKFTF
ncbi:MAG: hypothetical protein JNM93_01760 [Bacteriovoracaceae bacterium]|nr:hypothetical protein [Bacteriovoracaceae bacterium]